MAKVASYLKKVRQDIVPHLVNFSVEAMDNSAPVIRPLWMLDPHDPINQVIDDEFLIGDKVKTRFFKNRELYWSNLTKNSKLGRESFVQKSGVQIPVGEGQIFGRFEDTFNI